jgi:NDP-sugar pyrophosphorylase family protein
VHAFRNAGLWLTVNTPKDLRQAEEVMSSEAALTLVGRLG